MFEIDSDMTIYITRGDVAFFSVTAEDNGERYKFQPGDVVRIKVTQKKNCENVAFQKDFPVLEETETVEILLTEEETKIGDVISKPVDYWYEVELNPYTNPQTIIGYDDDGPKIFKLFPEGRDLGQDTEPEDVPVVDSELSLTSDRPVQNQAVTRAMSDLFGIVKKVSEDGSSTVAAMTKKVDDAVNKASKDTERLDTEIAVERARINNLVANTGEQTEGNAELIDIRTGADGTVYATAGEAVRGQVGELKETLADFTDDITKVVKSKNLLNLNDTDFAEGKYINPLNGALDNNSEYSTTGYIAVDEGRVIKFTRNNTPTDMRFICAYDENKNVLRDKGFDGYSSVYTVPSGVRYIRISSYASYMRNNFYPCISSLENSEDVPQYEIYFEPKTVVKNSVLENVQEQSARGITILPEIKTSIKKNPVISYFANVQNFNGLKLGVTTSDNWESDFLFYVDIDSTRADIHVGSTVLPREHGLTFKETDFIRVEWTFDYGGAFVLTITNESGEFTTTNWIFQTGSYYPFAVNTSTIIGGSEKLSFTCKDFQKDIFMFGDSYFSEGDNRWLHYLEEKDNVLLNGYSGETSVVALQDLKNILKYAKPKYIVWCMGMNDGSDNAGVQTASWQTTIDEVVSICLENNITPIFATIPSVPTISHKGKNTWVRKSGFRYIDFSLAVEDGDGNWYNDRLASDGVHPNVEGAKALHARFMVDFPEVVIN